MDERVPSASPDESTDGDLFRRLIEQSPAAAASAAGGVAIGRLLGLADDGCSALVVHPEHSSAVALKARSVVELRGAHVGQEVLLAFVRGNPTLPVVVGVLTGQAVLPASDPIGAVEVEADGQRLVISAQHEIVLRCGKSHLVLRGDGQVELRGETVTTHASRTNRIRGGSVELN